MLKFWSLCKSEEDYVIMIFQWIFYCTVATLKSISATLVWLEVEFLGKSYLMNTFVLGFDTFIVLLIGFFHIISVQSVSFYCNSNETIMKLC